MADALWYPSSFKVSLRGSESGISLFIFNRSTFSFQLFRCGDPAHCEHRKVLPRAHWVAIATRSILLHFSNIACGRHSRVARRRWHRRRSHGSGHLPALQVQVRLSLDPRSCVRLEANSCSNSQHITDNYWLILHNLRHGHKHDVFQRSF